MQAICLVVLEAAFYTEHTTFLLVKAGRLKLKPFYRTNALVYEGIWMTTFSSTVAAVFWLIENLSCRELYGM